MLISTDDEWESSGNDVSKFSETHSIDNEKCSNQVTHKAIHKNNITNEHDNYKFINFQ